MKDQLFKWHIQSHFTPNQCIPLEYTWSLRQRCCFHYRDPIFKGWGIFNPQCAKCFSMVSRLIASKIEPAVTSAGLCLGKDAEMRQILSTDPPLEIMPTYSRERDSVKNIHQAVQTLRSSSIDSLLGLQLLLCESPSFFAFPLCLRCTH